MSLYSATGSDLRVLALDPRLTLGQFLRATLGFQALRCQTQAVGAARKLIQPLAEFFVVFGSTVNVERHIAGGGVAERLDFPLRSASISASCRLRSAIRSAIVSSVFIAPCSGSCAVDARVQVRSSVRRLPVRLISTSSATTPRAISRAALARQGLAVDSAAIEFVGRNFCHNGAPIRIEAFGFRHASHDGGHGLNAHGRRRALDLVAGRVEPAPQRGMNDAAAT
ncbi:MAG: hypothetical protein IPM60_13200 [Rhodospirillales bacterium]|nr:hypothetical protein [Rhodospirillales bacterium]